MNVEDFNNLVWGDIILEDVDEAEHFHNIPRDVLDQRNPFQLSDEKFVKLFRLTKPLTEELIEMVTPFMVQPSRMSALTITTKVLAALRFYASGSYREITGSNSYVAISQPSTSRAIQEVTTALNRPEVLRRVRYPMTLQGLEELRTNFYSKYRFPGPVAVIDCTHISIAAPWENEHLYVNRKGYHSLNVQLICDQDLKILNVNARFPGSTHDSYIWRHSPVNEFMENVYRRNPGNVFCLLGDSGYPTRPWILTPLPNPQNEAEQHFNNVFCSVRSIIERCNGVLKNRFRCLLRHRTLHYNPITAGKIVNACCVLHNMCVENNIPEVDEPHEVEEPDYGIYAVDNYVDNVQRQINPDLAVARQLQQNIILNHFLN